MWIVAALIIGLITGWTVKTMVLVNQLSIERQGKTWLVYLGGRIIDRVTSSNIARMRYAQFKALLRGRAYKEE